MKLFTRGGRHHTKTKEREIWHVCMMVSHFVFFMEGLTDAWFAVFQKKKLVSESVVWLAL